MSARLTSASGLSSPSHVAQPMLTVAPSTCPRQCASTSSSARAQVLGHRGGRLAAGVGEQGEELLAAEAAELVLRPHAVAQRDRDRDQRGVAGVVAVVVVDALEAVDVDHRHRQLAAVAARAADQALRAA